jgi:NAD(P)-dependent dehydrogenase (short-subunit alcohol dehydrogenase family)
MRSFKQLASLEGRVALVTGGAGHIGRAIVDTLAEQGARVVAADLDGTSAPTGADLRAVDLHDETSTRGLVRDVVRDHGRLDVLVHCAAYVGTTKAPGWAVPFGEQSVGAWDAAIRVNLTAAFVLAQEARPALAKNGSGSIVFISSIYGVVGPDMRLYDGTSMQNPAAYGASKAALRQLGRHLSTIFAPEIRVNVVTPGGVARGQPESFVGRYVERTPLRRMATEEDFKGAVGYLASDLSAYVTGQEILVDGGWTAW